jgi:hypothetical protein
MKQLESLTKEDLEIISQKFLQNSKRINELKINIDGISEKVKGDFEGNINNLSKKIQTLEETISKIIGQ